MRLRCLVAVLLTTLFTTPAFGQVAKPPTVDCSTTKGVHAPKKKGDPDARRAAQKGLDFLSTAAVEWQEKPAKEQRCYGCHVQAVTLEAFAVGKRHQYEVKQKTYDEIVYGLTDIPGGARSDIGFNYAHGQTLRAPAKAFGGAALARHDQWIDAKLSDDLLTTAQQLAKYMRDDGSIELSWTNPPVGVGHVQGAYQAIVTFKQAYARSADERWLTNVQRAESYLQEVVEGWEETPPAHIQDVNYAVLGLLAAGMGTQEASLRRLEKLALANQNDDGGWGFAVDRKRKNGDVKPPRETNIFPGRYRQMARETDSNAFATGQTLYTLRMLGLDDDDRAIERGTHWLIEAQETSGGWSNAGHGKAEAMWGVLGLVSLDILSVTVDGIERGQHVAGDVDLGVEAWDNSGAKVVRIDLFVDDVHVARHCGDAMKHTWDASGLEDGKHVVEVRARNDRGEESRRAFEVFAGDHYITQTGTEFDDGGTRITLRDIAPKAMKHRVVVDIYSTRETDGVRGPHRRLRTLEQSGKQGSMSFVWDGNTDDGESVAIGKKYVAKVRFLDPDGKPRQTEELEFVHDTLAAQKAKYGEITGKLSLKRDAGRGAQNTTVELVDEHGNVVQSTRSTPAGQYRFENVDPEREYKVRVRKKGFETQTRKLRAPAAAEEAQADFSL